MILKLKSIWEKTNLTDLAIYGIAGVFVTVSAIQSAKGFTPFFNSYMIGLAVAVAISVGLFLYDHLMKKELEGQRSIITLGKLFAIYCIIALASFAGNFNAIFSNAVGKLPRVEQMQQLQTALSELEPGMITALERQDDYTQMKRKVEGLLPSLKDQITDKNNPGIGPAAKKQIRVLSRHLSAAINIPSTTENPVSLREAHRLYAELEGTIFEILKRNKGNSKMLQVIDEVKTQAASIREDLTTILSQKDHSDESLLERELEKSILGYNRLLGIGRSHGLKIATEKEQWRLAAAQTGQFDATLELVRSGLYPHQVWAALGQSLFLDLIVPILLLGMGIVRPIVDTAKKERLIAIEVVSRQVTLLEQDISRIITELRTVPTSKQQAPVNGRPKRSRKKRARTK